ncbi:ECF transporter S component [Compostimonas suwonensis]|uniref:Energy-coupling factor transport system substrate-specific component n=1 Tax=Compostimonas suwonensis TaxID=1048394 RepID=A0A2M9BZN0_9MICO|nr:ECF transporter S component [Compostimonas suwonensis]PJJ63538.1 energy-coupling factor transport system substrate-specific component [Compostimonas suwonensis]
MHSTEAEITSSTSGRRPDRTGRFRWRVVDIVVASVIGVASGVIFWVWGQAYPTLGTPLEAVLPGLQGVVNGGWLFAGVLGGLIVRKPGAALYTELLAAVVSALLVTQWGALTLLSGLVQGLGAEIVFAAFLYANYRVYVALIAGAGAGVACAVNDLIITYPGADAPFVVLYVGSSVVSGVVIAGLLSWLVMKGLARTGALSRFAAGREAGVRV